MGKKQREEEEEEEQEEEEEEVGKLIQFSGCCEGRRCFLV